MSFDELRGLLETNHAYRYRKTLLVLLTASNFNLSLSRNQEDWAPELSPRSYPTRRPPR